MKLLIPILFVLFQVNIVVGQILEVEKCGLDDKPTVSEYEARYFNEVYKLRRKEFDFTGKVIAFYNGPSGKNKLSKSTYFNNLKNGDKEVHTWQSGGTQLLILTPEEKELSGGYDVVLVSWSKLPKVGKSRTRLLKKLKKEHSNKG